MEYKATKIKLIKVGNLLLELSQNVAHGISDIGLQNSKMYLLKGNSANATVPH